MKKKEETTSCRCRGNCRGLSTSFGKIHISRGWIYVICIILVHRVAKISLRVKYRTRYMPRLKILITKKAIRPPPHSLACRRAARARVRYNYRNFVCIYTCTPEILSRAPHCFIFFFQRFTAIRVGKKIAEPLSSRDNDQARTTRRRI